MTTVLRYLARALELLFSLPMYVMRLLLDGILFNPHLGRLRYVLFAGVGYCLFAVILVYVIAPIRGFTGQYWLGQKLRYDSERWLATAIYDRNGNFVGTFDPMLDSKRDVNFTGAPIELADSGYVANPDHKSIPVRSVPDYYWRCLAYHEDRYVGTALNPYGIDLLGVLKIPFSTVSRTLSSRGLRIGVGGSTLAMQLARVIYETPPSTKESPFEKLGRKVSEWWDAPVIYWALTRGGDMEPFRQWTANHLWLAQRTGGEPLHGIEMTSRIVFGKTAEELSPAEQFVLASAVNKPIILLEGDEKLNAVRLDRWRYIVDVRARKCASELVKDETEQKAIWFELTKIANGPPDPQVKPLIQQAIETYDPKHAKAAQANPVLRANVLIPDARYGVREEMKGEYGLGWREYVRGVTLTLDVATNMRFRYAVKAKLTELQSQYASQIDPAFALDPAALQVGDSREVPDVVVAAANSKGEIIRFYETQATAAYHGSPAARDGETGRYDKAKEVRAIASIGKIVAAVAISNEGRDTAETPYMDPEAPAQGIDTCRHDGTTPRGRAARVVFACSLSKPIEWRLAHMQQARIRRLIDGFGLTMPRAANSGERTPPSTAVARGYVMASPRQVHQMVAAVLAALTGRGNTAVRLPTMVKSYDRSLLAQENGDVPPALPGIVPTSLIRGEGYPLLKTLLSAPLCTVAGKERIGTLKSISDWCAERKPGISLHFAKTGTQVTLDPDATVDAWAAGGIQFTSGASYSYVVVVGTGSSMKPWARKLHAAQIAAPLVDVLLQDLYNEARGSAAVADAAGTAKPSKKAKSAVTQ